MDNEYLKRIYGLLESGATLGTGAVSGLVGLPYGLYKGVTSGAYGTPEAPRIAAREAQQFMERNTYQPRTAEGQENLRQIAGLLEASKLPPVMPEASLLAAIPKQAYAAQAERAGMAAEKAIAPIVTQTMERGGLPAQLLEDLSQGSRRQIFIGKSSKSWNKEAEELALKMEKAGEKPEDIWMATGTFRGPDKKLRQEISDTGAKLTLGQQKPDEYGAIEANTFEGALAHTKLQQAYPELNDIKFQHWPKEEYQGANFDPNDNVVTMGQKAMEPERGVALHELQHAIQRKEGFAKGGSPSTVLNDWYAGVNSELSALVKQMDALPEYERKFDKNKAKQYDALREKYDALMDTKLYNPPDAEDAYRRLAGEAEARAVQKRMNMSDVQRRVIYPFESYDVPINQLIIKGLVD